VFRRSRPRNEEELRRQPDFEIVKACLAGHDEAWSELIGRYKNLIYSIPLRYGLDASDAADIFQSVCLDLYSELPKIRKIESLKSWLGRVTLNKCYHWRQEQRRTGPLDPSHDETASELPLPSFDMLQLETDQLVRDSIHRLPERCRRLIHFLFYENPPRPYDEVAKELGLATGSIGFIRSRCLNNLCKILKSMGL